MKGNSTEFPVDIENLPQEWLVLRTKPRQERVALCHLRERDVEPYCPLYLEPPWHKRAPKGPTPLFGGYIFVRCRPQLQLNAVRYCPGVLHPVRLGRELATVDQEIIDEIKRREAERGYIVPTELEQRHRRGTQSQSHGGTAEGHGGSLPGLSPGRAASPGFMEFLRQRSLVEVETELLAVVRA